MFKAQVDHAPYFYLQVREGAEMEVDSFFEAEVWGAHQRGGDGAEGRFGPGEERGLLPWGVSFGLV
jgi:hypothetical protein